MSTDREPVEDSPFVLDREPSFGTYQDAWVTPMQRPTQHNHSGEAYTSDLELIEASLRPSAAAMYTHVPHPPAERPARQRLVGTHLFAGHNFEMFGHDLIEFGTRLWPFLSGDLDVDGIVVIPWRPATKRLPASTTPAREILQALGFKGSVTSVTDEPMQVERLLVPDPAFFVNHCCLAICKDVFDAIRRAQSDPTAPPTRPHRRLFLSRRRLSQPARSPHEELLEAVALRHGYDVVHPETLTFAAQVRLMQQATAIAGLDGSAMHLAVFCQPGTEVRCFDTRHVRNQYVLESLMALRGTHVDLTALNDLDSSAVEAKFDRAFLATA
jgi:capsular polysaccharide biosynthesis protein